MTITDKLNFGLISATAAAVIWMFSTFASAADVDEIKLDQWYGQFYDRLDDRDDALEDGNTELAQEHERQMDRLRAKICEEDPKWERCKDSDS